MVPQPKAVTETVYVRMENTAAKLAQMVDRFCEIHYMDVPTKTILDSPKERKETLKRAVIKKLEESLP